MNILEIFENKVKEIVTGVDEQKLSECLVELATFFYKIDGRVSLEEQKYIDALLASVKWQSNISVESYQRDCIVRVNEIYGGTEEAVKQYLLSLMTLIAEAGGTEKAKTIAREISDADGEIADDEVKYLDYVMAFE